MRKRNLRIFFASGSGQKQPKMLALLRLQSMKLIQHIKQAVVQWEDGCRRGDVLNYDVVGNNDRHVVVAEEFGNTNRFGNANGNGNKNEKLNEITS